MPAKQKRTSTSIRGRDAVMDKSSHVNRIGSHSKGIIHPPKQYGLCDIFKEFGVGRWTRSSYEGEVTSVQDKILRCMVFRIAGNVPAANFIQIPKASSQSLNLSGRYVYLEFRATQQRYFVAHLDVMCSDGIAVRVSFSNLFKDFHATSTWLQFPYPDLSGRWTLLVLDIKAICDRYLSKCFVCLKCVRLCAHMYVRNVFTADIDYATEKLPRAMAFILPNQQQRWEDLYDYIRFPSPSVTGIESIPDECSSPNLNPSTIPAIPPPDLSGPPSRSLKPQLEHGSVRRVSKKSSHPDFSKTEQKRFMSDRSVISRVYDESNESEWLLHGSHPDQTLPSPGNEHPIIIKNFATVTARNVEKQEQQQDEEKLLPDPIMRLNRIIGVGTSLLPEKSLVEMTSSDLVEPSAHMSCRQVVWDSGSSRILYASHSSLISMDSSSREQGFFFGHTRSISGISFASEAGLVATSERGNDSVIRIWNPEKCQCLAIIPAFAMGASHITFSADGTILCCIGRDMHSKQRIQLWDTSGVAAGDTVVSVRAVARCDSHVVALRASPFCDGRLASCGRGNVRFWRLKGDTLHGCPVNLVNYQGTEFTDIDFDSMTKTRSHANDSLSISNPRVFVSASQGRVFNINYRSMTVECVYSVHDAGATITSIAVSKDFVMTGAADGQVRTWLLDFSDMILEVSHKARIASLSANSFSGVVVSTVDGNIGIVDIGDRSYRVLLRSHAGMVLATAITPMTEGIEFGDRNLPQLATAGEDGTVRVWSMETLEQVEKFPAIPGSLPCALAFHPRRPLLAVGFDSGDVRVFDLVRNQLVSDHPQHRAAVTSLLISPALCGRDDDGMIRMYSAASDGTLILYEPVSPKRVLPPSDPRDDVAINDNPPCEFQAIRMIKSLAPLRRSRLPCTNPDSGHHTAVAVTLSPNGRRLAFAGPRAWDVTIVDSITLEVVVRIDVTPGGPGAVPANAEAVSGIVYLPSGRELATVTDCGRLLFLDALGASGDTPTYEIAHAHRGDIFCISVSACGRYLITGGSQDGMIKIWDSLVRTVPPRFQSFLGHSAVVTSATSDVVAAIVQVLFVPGTNQVVSIGDAILVWDFLGPVSLSSSLSDNTNHDNNIAKYSKLSSPRHTGLSKPSRGSSRLVERGFPPSRAERPKNAPNLMTPRKSLVSGEDDTPIAVAPAPAAPPTPWKSLECDDDVNFRQHSSESSPIQQQVISESQSLPVEELVSCESVLPPPVRKHAVRRRTRAAAPTRYYCSYPDDAGMRLLHIMGIRGGDLSFDNIVWHASSKLFSYSCAAIVIVEDLVSRRQHHLIGHSEDITTMALSLDGRYIASASGSSADHPSQIIIWDVGSSKALKDPANFNKVMSYHKHEITALQFSTNGNFLASVGNYLECTLVVWNARSGAFLAASHTQHPVHALQWDPNSSFEFVTVGGGECVLFWTLCNASNTNCINNGLIGDSLCIETEDGLPHLKVAKARLPPELKQAQICSVRPRTRRECASFEEESILHFTALRFVGANTLFVGSNQGTLSAWDVRDRECFLTWDADGDNKEIDAVIACGARIITGGASAILRLWELSDDTSDQCGGAGLILDDEMVVDGGITACCFDDTATMGVVSTDAGTIWYINWRKKVCVRLVNGHVHSIGAVTWDVSSNRYLASCDMDGGLRIWEAERFEQVMNFKVNTHACLVAVFSPLPPPAAQVCVAGYSDGSVRFFDLSTVTLQTKFKPHACAVTTAVFSSDGRVVITGAADGLLVISSAVTGITLRVLNDHNSARITSLDVSVPLINCPSEGYWLAASIDRRVSIWKADWSRDTCNLIDWLTFPAPNVDPDGAPPSADSEVRADLLPPSLARFNPANPNVIIYTGYGIQKQVAFYDITAKQVIRSFSLVSWASAIAIAPDGFTMAIGSKDRIVKLMDCEEGTFQDFIEHTDAINTLSFSADGRRLLSAAHSTIFVWDVFV